MDIIVNLERKEAAASTAGPNNPTDTGFISDSTVGETQGSQSPTFGEA